MSRDLRILEPSSPPPEPDRPPVIVIQYRRSLITIVMMPIMILITAVAVLSHRIKAEDWRGLGYYLGFAGTATRENAPRKTASEPASPPVVPLVLTVVPEPAPPPMPAPSLLDPPVVKQETPPAAVAEAAPPEVKPPPALPPTAPAVQAQEIWDDIRKESERRQAEARILEDSKDVQLEQQQRLADRKKMEQLRRDQVKQLSNRQTFRNAVRHALAGPEADAGPVIRGLCEQEGVRIGASSQIYPRPGLVTTSTARRERVETLRAQHYSEAMILNDLILLENRNRVSRRAGIRSVDDVVVRAARHLLWAPLDEAEARLVKSSSR